MKAFFEKYKVLIFGLLTAIALPLNDLAQHGEISVKVWVYAGFTAGLTFVAKNFRGQWATISGILGTGLAMYMTMESNGTVNWSQLIMFMVLQILAAVAPPAKSIGYEKSDTIKDAVQEGENRFPTMAKPRS